MNAVKAMIVVFVANHAPPVKRFGFAKVSRITSSLSSLLVSSRFRLQLIRWMMTVLCECNAKTVVVLADQLGRSVRRFRSRIVVVTQIWSDVVVTKGLNNDTRLLGAHGDESL